MTNAFAPFIGPPGLKIGVNSGVLIITGAPVTVLQSFVTLIANIRNYVYIDYTNGNIFSNTIGFPNTNSYPIAIVDTTNSSVGKIIDARTNIFIPSSLSSINFSDAETPLGVIDGVNTIFILSRAPNPILSLQLFINGLLDNGYNISGNTITCFNVPKIGDVLEAFYRF